MGRRCAARSGDRHDAPRPLKPFPPRWRQRSGGPPSPPPAAARAWWTRCKKPSRPTSGPATPRRRKLAHAGGRRGADRSPPCASWPVWPPTEPAGGARPFATCEAYERAHRRRRPRPGPHGLRPCPRPPRTWPPCGRSCASDRPDPTCWPRPGSWPPGRLADRGDLHGAIALLAGGRGGQGAAQSGRPPPAPVVRPGRPLRAGRRPASGPRAVRAGAAGRPRGLRRGRPAGRVGARRPCQARKRRAIPPPPSDPEGRHRRPRSRRSSGRRAGEAPMATRLSDARCASRFSGRTATRCCFVLLLIDYVMLTLVDSPQLGGAGPHGARGRDRPAGPAHLRAPVQVDAPGAVAVVLSFVVGILQAADRRPTSGAGSPSSSWPSCSVLTPVAIAPSPARAREGRPRDPLRPRSTSTSSSG